MCARLSMHRREIEKMEKEKLPAAAMPDDMRKALLKKSRKQVFSPFLIGGCIFFLFFLFVGLFMVISEPKNIENWGFLVLDLCIFLAPSGVLVLYPMFCACRQLKRVRAGAFTYYITKLNFTNEKNHYVNGTTSSTYYLYIEDWRFPCDKREYRQAKQGDLYALIFFGGENPWECLRVGACDPETKA